MLRVGTCSFTAAGWETAFYPPGLKDAERLAYYAGQFSTVEIDSTFYRTPSARTVRQWYEQTPPDFRIAAKFPQVITHEKCLLDCDEESQRFLEAMGALEGKLAALLLQFPYFNKKVFAGPEPFVARLEPFLARLRAQASAARFPLALEVRNKTWLVPALLNLLRQHQVALALIDHPWMPRPHEFFPDIQTPEQRAARSKTKRQPSPLDVVTAGFTYIRLLGDRYKIEEQTKTWDKVIVDRRRELQEWTQVCQKLKIRGIDVLVYINNHYSGFAPANARELAEALGLPARAAAAAAASAPEQFILKP